MVSYEWKVEELESNGTDDPDIVSVWHYDTAREACANATGNARVCLVRDVGNDDQGVTDRWHAYPDRKRGLVYEENPDVNVPKKYLQEWARTA